MQVELKVLHLQQLKRLGMSEILLDIVTRNRAGEIIAIPSVCSAQPDVIRASLLWAERKGRPIVIEATSNQVNQDGGYTGKTPIDFATDVYGLADRLKVSRDRIVLGGDHLGTQVWRSLPAENAMQKARVLMTEYIKAGFSKIHLDCSEGCAGESKQLSDVITARRSAELAKVCEVTATCENTVYVIGTEVPPPGGARVDESGDIKPTTSQAAKSTLDAHEDAFVANGLSGLKERVAGLVVQPGVEFAPMHIHHMPIDRELKLREVMMEWPNLCLEAHSTDYQHPAVYGRLAELGFAFQKVGPALTFAYRQSLYALDAALEISGKGVGLARTMETLMLETPQHWNQHYAHKDRMSRHIGLADRIRYYWPDPRAQKIVKRLRSAAAETTLPDPLLWQVFSASVLERAECLQGCQVQRLIDAQIEIALDPYDVVGGAEKNE
jgi:D-tagatose-1,6-bisphosphate aldolase subunit GatZ/KbaZ